ncbi:hypothetical protein DL770_005280 [Monosporascus sp. CRB-9-2]|nr:hypothetical protein DL770_005280 [Monosporascus sp. CRB-9-2]
MPSLKTTGLAIASLLFTAIRADYYIDPATVPLALREAWCEQEESTCPIICEQVEPRTTRTNTCDPETLTYGCVCGNGLQPNMSEYSLTIPYFTCTEWGNQCVAGCGGDSGCQSLCREDHPCGAQHPTRVNQTSSATQSATQTPSAGETDGPAIFTGLDGSGATETDSPDSAAAIRRLESGSFGGFVVLVAGVCAGVAVML